MAAALRSLLFIAGDHRALLGKGVLTGMVLLPLPAALAADATWSSSATSGDWDTATNWLPAGAPGSAGDTASFGNSTITDISLATTTELDGITFNAGADPYTIRRAERYSLVLSGAGVINNSAVTQRFVVSPLDFSIGALSSFDFTGTATAGSNTEYRVEGTSDGNLYGQLRFLGRSTAGNGTFIASGGELAGGEILFYTYASAGAGNFTVEGANGFAGGTMIFDQQSTASDSTIRVWGSNVSDPTAYGGLVFFRGSSSAGNSSIYAYGGSGSNKVSGAILLRDNATAGDATLYALGGMLGGLGGMIDFSDNSSAGSATLITAPLPFYVDPGRIDFDGNSSGGTASVELTGKGELIIANHAGSGITVGSLEGDETSTVLLGTKRLTVGSNDTSTLFAGVLTGDDGSLGKIGSGTLRLSGNNSYSGGTVIDAGLLRVDNAAGSATGSGSVLVNSGGSLGGRGSVVGLVTVADGGRLAAGNSAGNLTLGSLVLSQASVLDYELAAPGGTPGVDSDLITVTGDLTLDGILDVTDLGGFDFGLGAGDSASYTLFNYGGTLVDNSLEFGQGLLAGYNYRIDTDTAGVVSLLAEFTGLQYWDGTNTSADGSIAGGDGNWTATSSNWTDQSGSANANWGELIGVFSGGAGAVEVDGTQHVRGLQFVTDGYLLRDADSNGNLVLSNTGGDIRADSGVTATLDVALAGNGSLLKTGAGTIVLQGNNSYTGDTLVYDGTLRLGASDRIADASALVINGGTFALGEFSETLGSLSGSGGVIDLGQTGNARLTINQTVDGTYAGDFVGNSDVDTSNALVKNGAATLTLSGTSAQTGHSGVYINAGRLAVTGGNAIADSYHVAGGGDLELLSDETLGGLSMDGGQVLLNDNTLTLRSTAAHALRSAADISGSGNLIIEGSGAQYFDSASSYTGSTTINGGLLVARNTAALGNNGALTVNSGGELELHAALDIGSLAGTGTVNLSGELGAQTLTLGVDGSSTTFSGLLTGEGGNLNKAGSGSFTLTEANSYSGLTQVNAGTLLVSNARGSATGTGEVNIASGATLGGTGNIGGLVTVADGGRLAAGSSAGHLTLGSLLLSQASVLDYELAGPAGVAGVDSDLISVTGDLTLNGILDVTDLGGFEDSGSQRLFNYDGALTNNGLTLGSGFLAGYDYQVDTATLGQVDLVVDYTGLQHWDGADGSADGVVTGGSGVWRASESNWTDSRGQLTAAWADLTGVFAGASGVVEVDGDLSISGLQFVSDGYRLEDSDGNGTLVLAAAGADVRANDGASATLVVDLSGTGALSKTGAGTIILAGNNSYSGGTTISDGVLQGDALSLQGNIANNAQVKFAQTGEGAYSRVVSGSGALIKSGAGLLVLSGANSYSGGTVVLDGILRGDTASLQGDISNSAQIDFVQQNDGVYASVLSGNGSLIKSGAGSLTLSGANSYTGLTQVDAGMLLVSNASGSSATGPGEVNIANGATLGGAGSVGGLVTVADGGRLAAGNSAGQLTLGSLLLSQASVLDYELTGPDGVAGVDSDLISVTGDLTLDGVLDVTDLGGFEGSGSHRLINYDGTLTNNGLTLGSGFLAGYNYGVDASTAGQIDLIVDYTGLQHWDGAGGSTDGVVNGGTGLWRAGETNWTDSSGQVATAWEDLTAVFAGASGAVEIDGDLSIRGLQFVSDGYRLEDSNDNGVLLLASAGADMRANAGVIATLNAALSGSGALIKTGAGTIVLAGSNSYSGGTTVSDGILQGDALSLQGDIVNNAQVNFAQAGEGTYSAVMSGKGALIKTGAGLLSLSGANSYSGGTRVLDGMLRGDTTSLQGDISNSAQLDFAQQTDGVYAGVLTGSGSLTKSGAGSLTLSGINSYAGNTLVEAGRLVVNGSIANSATTVNSGATLGGSGTFGSISLNGGTVAPGNSIGSLTVAGDLDFSGGAVYQVEVDAAGNSDHISAGGVALLTNGVVQVLPEVGDYRLNTSYSILSAAGGLGGTEFASVSSSLAFLTPSLSYDATTVSLNLRRNTSDYASVATTPNQAALAASLDAFVASGAPGSEELVNNIDTLTADGAQRAYDSLSGMQHSYSNLIALQNGRQFSGLLFDRLQPSAQPAESIGVQDLSPQSGWWLRGTGSYAELDGARYNASGTALGFDAPLDEQRTLGAAFGYSTTDADVEQGSLQLDSYQLALYGEWLLPNNAYFSGVTGLGYHEVDSSRNVTVGALSSKAEGDYHAWTGQAALEVGRSFVLQQSPQVLSRVTPLAGLEYAHVERSGFTEKDAAGLGLQVADDGQDSLRSVLGARFAHTRIAANGVRIEPTLELAWVHEFLDQGEAFDVALAAAPGAGFRVQGPALDRDRARLGLGLNLQFSDTAALEFGYRGEYASTDEYHDLSATLRMAW